jgi:hypothetical protein
MSLYPKGHPICVHLSFGASVQADNNVRFPCRALITKVKAVVVVPLADTDDGTIAIKSAAGATIATVTVPASTAIETEWTATIPANTIVERDSFLELEPAKTTAGGEVNFYVEYQPLGK